MTIYQYLKYYLMPFNSYSLLSAMGSGLLSYLKGYGVIFGEERRSNLAPLSFTQMVLFSKPKTLYKYYYSYKK